MTSSLQAVQTIIRERLKATGLSQRDASMRAGLGSTYVQQLLAGRTKKPSHQALVDLGDVLGVDLTSIATAAAQTAPRTVADHPPSEFRVLPGALSGAINVAHVMKFGLTGRNDLPVYAAAEGGGEGALIMEPTSNPIDWTDRPASLKRTPAAFAIVVVGDSMYPAYSDGDLALVHGGRRPTPGQDGVFIATEEDGRMNVLIKRLVRAVEDTWIVEQFNPKDELRLPRQKWQQAVAVIGRYDRGF